MSHSASLADYRAALTHPAARMPVLASLLARMPIAMIGISLLLFTQHETGSFAVASLVSGGDLVGVALGSVGQGRVQDRHGPTRPLLLAALALVVLTAAELFAVNAGAPTVLLVALAVGCGASQPNVASASRALWPRIISDEGQRQAAYSYEAISMEVFFILGPGFAGLLIAAPWPGTGVLVGTAAMVAGTVTFALTSTVRAWRPEAREKPHWLGALAGPGMRTLAVAGLGMGLLIGSVEVAVQAAATDAGHQQLGGVLLSLWSLASVVFGVLYSLSPYPRSLHLRLPVLLGAFAVLVAAMAVPSSMWGLALAMLLAGTMITPQSTAHSAAIEVVAPQGTVSEAFGWLITAVTLGLAVGQSAAGQLVELSGPWLAFLVAAAAGLLCASGLYALRRTLIPVRRVQQQELVSV